MSSLLGHGPLSHMFEKVMKESLKVKIRAVARNLKLGGQLGCAEHSPC